MRAIRPFVLAAMLVLTVAPARAAAPAAAARVEPGLMHLFKPATVMVRFRSQIPSERIVGLSVGYRFNALPAISGVATPAAVRALATRDDVAFIEADKPVVLDLDTATVASRARDVWAPVSGEPLRDSAGNVVDGRGVGIAIVDSGLDGTHPDFQVPGKVAGNYRVTPAGMVPMEYSSNATSAHGTHVAGIAAGNGLASGEKYRGVASGASLYGFEMDTLTVNMSAIAFDWIITNGASQTPPIRVVNNSWHCEPTLCDHPLNADLLHRKLASKMAESGIVVTWSAGNNGGDGDVSRTNPEATNRTPGIIGVANYKDEETGTRDACLSSSSSWGTSLDATTWPDVSAPGRSVWSTWGIIWQSANGSPTTRNPVTGANTYRVQTGTSMSAPHVAGIVALMLQANPALTPAEAEYIVKQTSTPLVGSPELAGCGIDYINADPSHPWNGANYAAGHGLVDARAAVELADGFAGIPAAPAVEPIPDDFIVSDPSIIADSTRYLAHETSLTETYPDADVSRVQVMSPDSTLSFTSGAFGSDEVFDALKADLFLGTSSEQGSVAGGYAGVIVLRAQVYRVNDDGDELIAERETRNYPANTLAPVHRKLIFDLEEPLHLASDDRIRVEVRLLGDPYYGVPPGVNLIGALYTESFTPSRLIFGTKTARPDPESRAGCERRRDCAMVDATHPMEGVVCDASTPFQLEWTGPVGSTLIYNCDGVTYTCPVLAEDPGRTDGTCRSTVTVHSTTGDLSAFCTYRMPDGSRGGSGRCYALGVVQT